MLGVSLRELVRNFGIRMCVENGSKTKQLIAIDWLFTVCAFVLREVCVWTQVVNILL